MHLAPPPPRLLLLSLGAPQDPDGPALLLPAVAERLSGLCGLPLRPFDATPQADAALAGLQQQPGPWLAPLPLDPGVWRPGGSWAEALGAWRQPCLLVIGAGQLASGLPAAGTALLERWRVPLIGLLQGGGRWDAALRRSDGLPWLGWLATEAASAGSAGAGASADQRQPPALTTAADDPDASGPEDLEAALPALLQCRWRQLMAELA